MVSLQFHFILFNNSESDSDHEPFGSRDLLEDSIFASDGNESSASNWFELQ